MKLANIFLSLVVTLLMIGVSISSADSNVTSDLNPPTVSEEENTLQQRQSRYDNAPDLAIVNTDDRDVSILINDNSGSFGQRTDYPITKANISIDIASGDFNQDGLDDYAVTTYTPETGNYIRKISIFLADGNGGFKNIENYTAKPCRPNRILCEDFNNDGYPDLVFTGTFGLQFYVMLNKADGNGTFLIRSRNTVNIAPYNNKYPYNMVAEDFNNDGNMDLAFCFNKDSDFFYMLDHVISVCLGDGTGNFEIPRIFNVGYGYGAGFMSFGNLDITAGDYNNDGNIDIATTNTYDRDVSVLYGDGEGNFPDRIDYPVSFNPGLIETGDFNNDGNNDLLVGISAGFFEFLLGDGTGSFSSHHRINGGGLDLMIDDYNMDGNLDIAATQPEGYIKIYLGKGDAYFEHPQNIGAGQGCFGITSGEFGNSTMQATNNGQNNHERMHHQTINADSQNSLSTLNQNDRELISPYQEEYEHITPFLSEKRETEIHKHPSAFKQQPVAPSEQSTTVAPTDRDSSQNLDIAVEGSWSRDINTILGRGPDGVQNRKDFPTGTRPQDIAQGDFNTDGNMDIAVNNIIDRQVNVLFGDGKGDFTNRKDYDIGCNSQEIITTDINSDGSLDIIVSNADDNNLTILYNDGAGVFDSQINLATGIFPWGIASGDLNYDGYMDIVVANYYDMDKEYSVYLNKGDGITFNRTDYNVSSYRNLYPRDVIIDDFNNDNVVDIVILMYYSDAVYVFFGDGSGVFSDRADEYGSASTDSDQYVQQMKSADFDNDGNLDLAVSCGVRYWGDGVVNILFNDGTGDFDYKERLSIQTYAVYNDDLVTVDFNKDGLMDVAVTHNYYFAHIDVIYGLGNRTFSEPYEYKVGYRPDGIVAGDYNNDGESDLIVVNNRDNDVSVLLGDGTGGFQTQIKNDWGDSRSAYNVVKADFNGDQYLDIAFATRYEIRIFTGDGTGSFPDMIEYSYETTDVWPGRIYAADFNADGSIDIAAIDYFRDTLAIAWNNGSGGLNFDSKRYTVGNMIEDMTSYDFNCDGYEDIAVVNYGDSTVGILLSDGDNGFRSQQSFSTAQRPTAVVRGDFNQDTYIDLALTSYLEDCVSVLYGDGTGSFDDRADYPVGWFPRDLSTTDLNEDGLLDLIVGIRGRWDRSLSVLLGRADGSFEPSEEFVASQETSRVTSADLNHDGHNDVVCSDYDDDLIHIFYGEGTGDFSSILSTPVGWHPQEILIGEFDGLIPSVPIITGPSSGKPGEQHTFTIQATDAENDDLYYQINWKDGTISNWLGPYPSGKPIDVSHTWQISRELILSVVTKDTNGIESLPGTYFVSMVSDTPSTPVITGPNEISSEQATSFTFTSTDSDGNELYYYIDWDDGTTEEWIGPYQSGEEIIITHRWSEPTTYRLSAQVKDEYETISEKSYHSLEVTNSQPHDPSINGPRVGKARRSIDFDITTTDPEGHHIFLLIDWGDGQTSGWIGPYNSSTITVNHSYNRLGRYTIRILGKDIYDAESNWTEQTITILPSLSHNQSYQQSLLYRVCSTIQQIKKTVSSLSSLS